MQNPTRILSVTAKAKVQLCEMGVIKSLFNDFQYMYDGNSCRKEKKEEKLLRNVKHKFSLLIDESTDVSTIKQLALAVKFFNNIGSVQDNFL